MGAKLRARLPEGNSLSPEVADDYAARPRQMVALVLLDVDTVTRHVQDEDSQTTTFEILMLEHLEGDDAADIRKRLDKRHEDRTGEATIPYDDIGGSSTGDPAEYERQADLLRQEVAARLREESEEEKTETGHADKLRELADQVESGEVDPQADAVRDALPGGLAFSHAEEPQQPVRRGRRGLSAVGE